MTIDKMTIDELVTMIRAWTFGDRPLSLSGADLKGADLYGANLYGANLSRADLYGANLEQCIMNWQSNKLIGWRLYNAAITDTQQAMAAFIIIGHKDNWCWDEGLAYIQQERNQEDGKWALELMRSWVKEGDGAPAILKGKTE